MTLVKTDSKVDNHDLKVQRQANGTVGSDHIVPSGIRGRAINNVVTMFDQRISYDGNWTLTIAGTQDFLAQRAWSNTVGSGLSINFIGTSISLLGNIGAGGGVASVYIDGNPALGAVNTTTMVSTIGQYPFLPKDNTTIFAGGTFSSVNNFSSAGTIRIDSEEITYTGVDLDIQTFTGCSRGANGTEAATHITGSTISQMDSTINFESPYPEGRIVVWSKNNLSPGEHTLSLVLDSINGSSSPTFPAINLAGVVLGGMLGGPVINTNFRYILVGPATTDPHGRLGPSTLQTDISNEQFITPIGCAPVANCNTAYPMWDTNGNFYVVTDAASTANVSALVYVLNLGPSI